MAFKSEFVEAGNFEKFCSDRQCENCLLKNTPSSKTRAKKEICSESFDVKIEEHRNIIKKELEEEEKRKQSEGKPFQVSMIFFHKILRLFNSSSDDKTRPYICGVHYQDGQLQATDGYILSREKTEESFEASFIISNASKPEVKRIVDSGHSYFNIVLRKKSILVSSFDGESEFLLKRYNDKPYPETKDLIDRCLIKKDDEVIKVCINPRYLLRVFKSIQWNKKNQGIILNIKKNKDLGGIALSVKNEDSLGIIMPLKVE